VIRAFKYQGRRALAEPLARLMKEAGGAVLAGADAVVPVPLHPVKALVRGFNQADDLAAHLGPPVWRVLRRTRLSAPQAALPAHRRPANVRGAFAPCFGIVFAPARSWRRRLEGRTVVLIDDVMTTGATLDACSEVLLAAGVRTVRALTAARAVAGRPRPHPEPHRRAGAPHR
jgi:ComF family protein